MLKRFYTAIVRRRKAVLTLFALVAVLCVFAMRQVQVDYDLKVTNTVSGQQAYLSRVSRDTSGGENQAPF